MTTLGDIIIQNHPSIVHYHYVSHNYIKKLELRDNERESEEPSRKQGDTFLVLGF